MFSSSSSSLLNRKFDYQFTKRKILLITWYKHKKLGLKSTFAVNVILFLRLKSCHHAYINSLTIASFPTKHEYTFGAALQVEEREKKSSLFYILLLREEAVDGVENNSSPFLLDREVKCKA